jgi:hypothetical protein
VSKLELAKSIEAVKLNRRSKLPVQEPPALIPYGAIVQDIEEDGNLTRFTHLGELYQVTGDALRSAAARVEAAAVAAPERPAAPSLQWERVETTRSPLWRAKVPGGWLLTLGASETLTFYPDATHSFGNTKP